MEKDTTATELKQALFEYVTKQMTAPSRAEHDAAILPQMVHELIELIKNVS